MQSNMCVEGTRTCEELRFECYSVYGMLNSITYEEKMVNNLFRKLKIAQPEASEGRAKLVANLQTLLHTMQDRLEACSSEVDKNKRLCAQVKNVSKELAAKGKGHRKEPSHRNLDMVIWGLERTQKDLARKIQKAAAWCLNMRAQLPHEAPPSSQETIQPESASDAVAPQPVVQDKDDAVTIVTHEQEQKEISPPEDVVTTIQQEKDSEAVSIQIPQENLPTQDSDDSNLPKEQTLPPQPAPQREVLVERQDGLLGESLLPEAQNLPEGEGQSLPQISLSSDKASKVDEKDKVSESESDTESSDLDSEDEMIGQESFWGKHTWCYGASLGVTVAGCLAWIITEVIMQNKSGNPIHC